MTRALILAAGQGTRLRPLTNSRPKAMVPLLGVPLAVRQLRVLRAAGVSPIGIVAGYLGAQFEGLGAETIVNADYETTNMVASLFTATDFIMAGGDLVVGYGDIVYTRQNLAQLLASGDDIALMIDIAWRDYWAMRFEDPLSDAETLVRDADDFIVELGKKPSSYDRIQGQYTGLIKIRGDRIADFVAFHRALDRGQRYDGRDVDNMFMTSLLQLLIDAGWRVRAVPVRNGWLEVDSVEDLALYERLAAAGKLARFFPSEPAE